MQVYVYKRQVYVYNIMHTSHPAGHLMVALKLEYTVDI